LAKESLEHNIILVSSLRRDLAEMCFFRHAFTLEEALVAAHKRHGKEASVLIVPYGNLTLVTKD
jgi:lactate racemase